MRFLDIPVPVVTRGVSRVVTSPSSRIDSLSRPVLSYLSFSFCSPATSLCLSLSAVHFDRLLSPLPACLHSSFSGPLCGKRCLCLELAPSFSPRSLPPPSRFNASFFLPRPESVSTSLQHTALYTFSLSFLTSLFPSWSFSLLSRLLRLSLSFFLAFSGSRVPVSSRLFRLSLPVQLLSPRSAAGRVCSPLPHLSSKREWGACSRRRPRANNRGSLHRLRLQRSLCLVHVRWTTTSNAFDLIRRD